MRLSNILSNYNISHIKTNLYFLKENWIILIAFFTFLGSLGQFSKLVFIEPRLIIYFSSSRAIIEGILFFTFVATQYVLIYLNVWLYIFIDNSFNSYKYAFIIRLIGKVFFFCISLKLIYEGYPIVLFIPFIVTWPILLFVDITKDLFTSKVCRDIDIAEKEWIDTKKELFILSFIFYIFSFLYYMHFSSFPYYRKIENIPGYFKHKINDTDISVTFKLVFYNDQYVIYEGKLKGTSLYRVYEATEFYKVDRSKLLEMPIQ